MLQGRADSQQQQLRDVLAFHVIPRLDLQDVSTLSQTCSSLWQLVQKDLPGVIYRSLALKTFPAGHPILAVDNSSMQAEIRGLAALHASIRSGHVVSATTSCLWEGNAAEVDALPAPNHRGDRALSQRNGHLQLHRLDLSAEQPLQEILWTAKAPEYLCSEEGHCRLYWSPDNCWAAIWYAVPEFVDDDGVALKYIDVLYMLDMASLEISEVTRERDDEMMLAPIIAPDSTLMVIPWSAWFYTSAIEIYSCSQRTIFARIDGLANYISRGVDGRLGISPDGLRVAASIYAAGTRVYQTGGKLHLELQSGQVDDQGYDDHQQVAWSPDGSSIASWQPSLSMVHVFDAMHGLMQESLSLDMGPNERGADLLWGIYGIVPVLRDSTVHESKHQFSSMFVGCNPASGKGRLDKTPLMGVVKVDIGLCMPALSPGGAFIAAVNPAQQLIQIFDVQSGTCVSEHGVVLDQSSQQRVAMDRSSGRLIATLSWAPSGRCLMLQVEYLAVPQDKTRQKHKPRQKQPRQKLVTVLTF